MEVVGSSVGSRVGRGVVGAVVGAKDGIDDVVSGVGVLVGVGVGTGRGAGVGAGRGIDEGSAVGAGAHLKPAAATPSHNSSLSTPASKNKRTCFVVTSSMLKQKSSRGPVSSPFERPWSYALLYRRTGPEPRVPRRGVSFRFFRSHRRGGPRRRGHRPPGGWPRSAGRGGRDSFARVVTVAFVAS